MTSTCTHGIGTILVPSASAQGIGQGTHGSASSSIGVGEAREGTSLQGAGVEPSCSPSLGRDTGRYEEQHEEVVVPKEATLGCRRPKWLQDTLREARDAGDMERVMSRGKAPERFCSYIDSVSSITDSKPSSFQEAANQ